MQRNDFDYKGKTIWLADDYDIFEDLLKMYGANVRLFKDPGDAAEAIKELGPRSAKPDLILTDYGFSQGITGNISSVFYEAFQKHESPAGGDLIVNAVKSSKVKSVRDIPIVICSGDNNLEYLHFPGTDVKVFIKPVAGDDLYEYIEQRLQESRAR